MKKTLSALFVATALVLSTLITASDAAPVRKTEHLLLHAIRANVQFTDITGNSEHSAKVVGKIPAGSFVVGSVVQIPTAFTSAATPSLSVGSPGATGDIMTTGTLAASSTGRKLGVLSPITVTDTEYSVYASATDYTALDAGEAEVIIYYYPHAQ